MLIRERHKNSPREFQVTESLVRDLETIRRGFTAYLRARGYAEATIEWYLQDFV